MSKIEWTEKTWNPIVGCSVVSPGCTNCYAMKMAHRLQKMNRTGGSGTNYVNHYDGTTKVVNGKAVWTGHLAPAPDKLFLLPLRTKRPTMWFVNSMSDLFHEDVPDTWIDRVLFVMRQTPHHTYQVLTKRAERMRNYFEKLPQRQRDFACHSGLDFLDLPLPNVWLGVSCEDQSRADARIPDLLATPAAVRFVSAEPLLGPIEFDVPWPPGWQRPIDDVSDGIDALRYSGRQGRPLDWVIVGGESGPDARPMHPDWARSIRDQCQDAGVSFFFKQWGGFAPVDVREGDDHVDPWRGDVSVHRVDHGYRRAYMRRIGKKRAGRLLDGREWSEMPSADHGRVAA